MKSLLAIFLAAAPALAQAPAADEAPPTPAQIERLVQALTKDESYKVRLQAAVRLGQVTDERIVQPLIDALNDDPHYTVRAAAAKALATVKEPRAITHLVKRIAIDPEAFVRDESTSALEKYERAVALPYVVASCGSPDSRVRKFALTYLAAAPTPAAEPVFAKALGDTPEIFAIAKEVIKKLPWADQLRFLDAAIDDREPAVRRGAIAVLEDIGTPDAAQRVLRAYERDIEEDEVRNAARNALRKLKSQLPTEAIIKAASTGPEKHTRARALRLLGVLGGPEADKVLRESLKDDDPYVRGNAVMAMGELGDASVVPLLEKLAQDPQNQRIVHLVRHTLKQLKKTP